MSTHFGLIRRKRALVLVFVILIAALFSTTSTTYAAGPSWTITSLNAIGCNSGNITFSTLLSGVTLPTTLRFHTLVDAGGLRYMDEDAGVPGGGNGPYGWSIYASSSGGPTTGTFPIPIDTSITIRFELIDGVNGPAVAGSQVVLSKCNGGTMISNTVLFSSTSSGGTFFNPGDDRVDPRPGDRLAVYCNQPDKIVVYGIADDLPQIQSGFHLVTFSYKAIVAAGPKGLTRSAGAMGSVSVSVIQGWFWIAWNGGKYNATGQGIFVKNFEDAAWCSRAH